MSYIGDKDEPLRRALAAINAEEYRASKRIYDAFADGEIESDAAAFLLGGLRRTCDQARKRAEEAPAFTMEITW